jgi:hypothetical protein
MLPTAVYGTDCSYLAPLIGLKELAVVGECFAYYGDRGASINDRRDVARLWILEANSAACLNNVT